MKVLLILTLLISASCGQNVDTANTVSETPNRGGRGLRVVTWDELDPGLRAYLSKQSVSCNSGDCPTNIAKIVISQNRTTSFCTGVLVDKNKIISSASCFPKNLQVSDLSCSDRVFFFFPQIGESDSVKVQCKRVAKSSYNFESDPSLWRDDIIEFELLESVNRPLLKIRSSGVTLNKTYSMWGVETLGEFNSELVESKCKLINKSYANPYSLSGNSPILLSAGCELLAGQRGGYLLDDNNQIVALNADYVDEKVGAYVLNSDILTEPLDQLYNLTNLSCYYGDTHSDCNIVKTVQDLEDRRLSILNDKTSHHSTKEKLINLVSESLVNEFFELEVFFVENFTNLHYHLSFKPKCFKNIKNWIYKFSRRRRVYTYSKLPFEFDIPSYSLEVKLDKYLRATSMIVDENLSRDYVFYFNPASAYFSGETFVNIKNNFWGEGYEFRYDNIKACN